MGMHFKRRAARIMEESKAAQPSRNFNDKNGSCGIRPQVSMGAHPIYENIPTFCQRPISKWCRYGYWSPDGSELTVTRVDIKRRAVWL